MESSEGSNSKRKNENLEVTGVSRSGRVRKKSSKLVDFESTDEVDNRHKRKLQSDKTDQPSGSKPKKIQKAGKNKAEEDGPSFSESLLENENNDIAPGESDTDNDLYQPHPDDDVEYEVDEEDDDDDDDDGGDDYDDDDEFNEGQLVVDEKTPTQSLYMMEKSKKKLVIKDGKVIGTAKAQRKDKGKARFTAYMMWAKEIRQELNKQYPDMDFTTMARRLSELWGTVPNSERELWRRKAKREAAKKQKPKQEAPLMPSRKFINRKGAPVQLPLNITSAAKPAAVSSHESVQQQVVTPVRKHPEFITSPGLYKVTGIAPIDVAAHLKLLGESLFIIGERLQEHEGQIAVSGSLSVLLDSLLCAVGPLLCLTQQVEEMKSNKQVLGKILQNVAYMMPGLANLTPAVFNKFKESFFKDLKNVLALNACARIDPLEVCTSRRNTELSQHVYQYCVETEGKPMTNQKSTGCCWIYACLNVIRIPFMKHFNLEKFEFSQSYIFFWDKLERCNFWLHNIVKTAKAGEPIDGRLVSFLLKEPIFDGGQWDMLCNIINKYGLMPKKCFPETFSSESSGRMNAILKSTLRKYAKELREMIDHKKSDEEIEEKIIEQMSNIYRIVSICLSVPPETFIWEYTNKAKVTQAIGPLTPQEFYKNHVKPLFNVDDKVCLVNDPRSSNPFNTAFTVDCLGNMVGGRPIIYNNQPVELLMKLSAESVKNNEAVWFGCEVSKRFANKAGIEDLEIHDYQLVFGVDPSLDMKKGERLVYGDSSMTHAMVFTGVSFDENGEPSKFKVENSWGEDRGKKGYLLMTAPWFKEFVFEVVVDKKFVSESVMNVFEQVPKVLPAWDPMGALARLK